MDFIKKHINFKFYGVSLIAFLVGLSIIPSLMYMPQEFGFENGLIENIQMTVLFIMVFLCASAKQNKKFLHFCILFLSILIIREVNCGRTLFFPIEGEYHKYYSWRDLPWKWLGKVVHGVYGTYISIVSILFFTKKIHIDFLNILKNIKLPFWNVLFAIFAMFMGAIAEKLTNNNFIFEEGFELFFYVSIMGIIWLYSRNKDFEIETNQEE